MFAEWYLLGNNEVNERDATVKSNGDSGKSCTLLDKIIVEIEILSHQFWLLFLDFQSTDFSMK